MRRSLFVVALGLAACGSKSHPQPTMVSNTAGSGSHDVAIPAGTYLCRFEEGGFKYDPYPCTVDVGGASAKIAKVGGFERFSGTITVAGHDLDLDAMAGCDDGSTGCNIHFTGTLSFVDKDLWSGNIKADAPTANGQWWLDGGTLDLEHLPPGADPMGGQLYGNGNQTIDDEEEGD